MRGTNFTGNSVHVDCGKLPNLDKEYFILLHVIWIRNGLHIVTELWFNFNAETRVSAVYRL